MQWPCAQTFVAGCASVSFMQASSSKPLVRDILEVNKTMRFFKENASLALKYVALDELDNMRYGFYFDASFASRADLSSQGGYLLFAIPDSYLDSGKPVPLIILDWSSKKLDRVARSSLSAEAQSGGVAVDHLDWFKTFFVSTFFPDADLKDQELGRLLGRSPVITDAKALFDAAKKSSAGRGLLEKRTAIDVKIICEKMQCFGGYWTWTNSDQQLGDGLTKPQARVKLAQILARGYHCLKFDPMFVAAKKRTNKQKEDYEKELDAAKEHDGQAFTLDEQPAVKVTTMAKADRHFATMPNSAAKIVSILTAAHLTKAAKGQDLKEEDNSVKFTLMIMTLIFLAGVVAGCMLQCCWRKLRFQAVVQLRRDYAPRQRASPPLPPQLPQLPIPRTTIATQTEPPPPMAIAPRPQKIYVTSYGSQYHTVSSCGGLGSATTLSEKIACITCIEQVDGDGTRRRAR